MSVIDEKAPASARKDEKSCVKKEMERILEKQVVANRPPKIEGQPDLTKDWCFHNTKKLLQRYRSTMMCISAALDDLDEDCLGSLGVRFSALGQFAEQMDVDAQYAAQQTHASVYKQSRPEHEDLR